MLTRIRRRRSGQAIVIMALSMVAICGMLALAIDAGRRLTLDEIAGLAGAFSESDLPYRVDLVDWHDINDHWRQAILADRVALTEGA